MICAVCGSNNANGERYCKCGEYLRAEPGSHHQGLLQLSRSSFLDTLSEGLPLISGNVTSLWIEAKEISQVGPRRAVGILQGLAEEEAAKILLLLDCLRCPQSRIEEYRALLKGFNKHLAKGVYGRYYDTRPSNLAEVRHIVDLERQNFSREGDYGEFTVPNVVTYWRERRLYVSYVRNDDDSHSWQAPYPPDLLDGHIVPSGAVSVVQAMGELGLFLRATLAEIACYWQKLSFEPVASHVPADAQSNVSWAQLREYNLNMFQPGGINFERGSVDAAQTVVDRWLFPLYPLSL